MIDNKKKCCRCRCFKSLNDFSNNRAKKDGLQKECKSCRSEQKKVYQNKNKEAISKQKKVYRQTDIYKASLKNTQHKRRTQTNQGDITSNQILELQQNAKVCYWCNTSLKNKVIHIDHYIPLSKGGEHTLSNLVVSCPSCNMSKGAKDPQQFANKIGRLL